MTCSQQRVTYGLSGSCCGRSLPLVRIIKTLFRENFQYLFYLFILFACALRDCLVLYIICDNTHAVVAPPVCLQCIGLVDTQGNFCRQLWGNHYGAQDHLGSTWVKFKTLSYRSTRAIGEHCNVNAFSSWRLPGTGSLLIASCDMALSFPR